eukprot:149859-Pyramimonas_sp.AAC.1
MERPAKGPGEGGDVGLSRKDRKKDRRKDGTRRSVIGLLGRCLLRRIILAITVVPWSVHNMNERS